MTPEQQGFDDGTSYMRDEAPATRGQFDAYHKPPAGLLGCPGCASNHAQTNDCPRCQYNIGFTEGMSK